MQRLIVRAVWWLAGCGVVLLMWWWLGRPVSIAVPGFVPDTQLDCVSYTPYESDQSPWDVALGATVRRERLEIDLALIAQHAACIRVYSANGLGDLPAVARKYQLHIMLGAWINADPVDSQRELARVVALAQANPDVVRAVIVGNEVLLRKEATAAQLIEYLQWMRAQLPVVPLTYADVWEFWIANPSMATAVDFATIHVLPYWENQPTPAAQAVAHLEHVIAEMQATFPHLPLFIGETGWPTEGRARQQSRANRATAAEYVQRVSTALRVKKMPYNIIEAFDQPWKRFSEGTVGGYWGLFDTQRRDKGLLQSFVSNVPDWSRWCVYSIGVWFVLLFVTCCEGWQVEGAPLGTPAAAPSVPAEFSAQSGDAVTRGRNLTGPITQMLLLFSSAALVWQAREYSMAVRNLSEALWAIAVLLIATVGVIGGLRASMQRPWLRQLMQYSQQATLLVLALTALAMAVDARYRAFPNAALSVAVLGWWLQSRAGIRWTPRNPLAWVVLLVGCGAASLWSETLWNRDVWWWLAIVVVAARVLSVGQTLAAYCAWFRTRWRVLAVVTGAAAIAMVLRYCVMESTPLVEVCALRPSDWQCQLRDTAGLLIHYRYCGTAALVLAAVSWRCPVGQVRRIGVLMALIAATCGLTLYGIDRASWGFLAAWALATALPVDPAARIR